MTNLEQKKSPITSNNKLPKVISLFIPLLLIITGLTVMYGWLSSKVIFMFVIDNLPSMKFNTALCFFLLGTALTLLNQKNKKAVVPTVTVFIISSLTAVQYTFGFDIGIDNFFITDTFSQTASTKFPGRMSPVTDLCFIISSILILLKLKNLTEASFLFSALLMALAIFSCTGLISNLFLIEENARIWFFSSMAIHTAFLFFMTFIQLLLVKPSSKISNLILSSGLGSIFAKRQILISISTVLLLGWLCLTLIQYQVLSLSFGFVIFIVAQIILGATVVLINAGVVNKLESERNYSTNMLGELSELFDGTPDALVVVNEQGLIVMINEQTSALFQYSKLELENVPVSALIPERFSKTHSKYMSDYMKTKETRKMGTSGIQFAMRKDKSEFPCEISLKAVNFNREKMIIATIRDITERQKFLEQIQDVEERLNLATMIAEIGIWEYSVNDDFLVWNDMMFRIYDVDKNKFSNSFQDWENTVHQDDLTNANLAFEQSVQTGGRFEYQFRIVQSSGSIKYIKARAKAILDENGSTKKMVGVNYDITDFVEAEQNATKSYELYKAFIDQSPNATAMFDKDMKYLAASDKWLTDYHVTTDVIGKSHYDVFPEIGDDWKQIHKECLAGDTNVCDKAEFKREDGTSQFIRWDVKPWYWADNKIGGILMFTEDITKRIKEEEEKLRTSNLLRETQQIARIGAWEYYVETQNLFWDSITKSIHEVPDEYIPLLENGINFYKPGKSRDIISKVFTEALTLGKPYDIELQLITALDNEIWVRAIGKPILNDHNECIKISGLFQDISKDKKKEIELRISMNRFEGAFKHSAIGIALVSLTGKWLRVNDAVCNIFGYDETELLAKTFQEITHPQDLEKDLELLQKTLSGELQSYQMEKRYLRKNGETVWAMLSVALIRDEKNDPLYFVSQIENITERVLSDEKLRTLNKELNLLTDKLSLQNKSLSDFAHITSHNLRSPVGNLNTLKHLYDSTENDEEKTMLFSKMSTVITHLSNTLNELIEALIVKEGAGQNIEEVNFEATFKRVEELLSGSIMNAGAIIETDFNGFDQMLFNKLYLESILMNLMSNAIKYRNPDIQLRIHIQTELKNGQKILHFSDNGLGIDLKRHGRKIFGLHKTFHRNSDAKGVGLFMVKTQIESMGGSIKVDSEPFVGTKFTIIFA